MRLQEKWKNRFLDLGSRIWKGERGTGNSPKKCGSSEWSPPPLSWLKCSIGTERNSQLQIGGGLWVVRDHMGDVFLHSRQIFPANSRHDAKFETLLWTIRGVTSHKLHRVIFAIEDHCLVGIVTKPIKWHAYKFLNSEPIMANWVMYIFHL